MPDYGMRGNLHHSWAGERYANTGTRRREGKSDKSVKITALVPGGGGELYISKDQSKL